MTLNQFIEREIERIESFKLFWQQNAKLNIDAFPLEMTQEHWTGQLKLANECFAIPEEAEKENTNPAWPENH